MIASELIAVAELFVACRRAYLPGFHGGMSGFGLPTRSAPGIGSTSGCRRRLRPVLASVVDRLPQILHRQRGVTQTPLYQSCRLKWQTCR
jgi:hypothetical protein